MGAIHHTLYPMLRTSHYHIALLVTFLTLSGCSDKKAPLPPPAATNAATQPPQAPAPIEEPPEEATLMRAVFGANYDANRKRATINQSGSAVTALAQTALPDGEMLLLTHLQLLDDKGNIADGELELSMGSFSLYVLRKQDGTWKVTKRHEDFSPHGWLGDSGMVRWMQLGQGKTGLALVRADIWEGLPFEMLHLYDVSHGNIRNLTNLGIKVHSDNNHLCELHLRCWDVTGKWKQAAAPAGTDYPDVLIEFTGKVLEPVEGATETTADTDPNIARTTKPVKAQARYRFDGTSYKLIEGKNAAREL